MSKTKPVQKLQEKLLPKEKLVRLLNTDIAGYLKSKELKDWRGNTEDDLQEVVAKMNSIVNSIKE